jgi:hypothetical protein
MYSNIQLSYRPDLAPDGLGEMEVAALDYCAGWSKHILQGRNGRFLKKFC